MSKTLYILTEFEIDGAAYTTTGPNGVKGWPVGPNGRRAILLSNVEYQPTAGPYAGVPYRQSWLKDNLQGWTFDKAGVAMNGNLLGTVGLSAFKPGQLSFHNAKINGRHELDDVADLPSFHALVTIRMAWSKADKSPPEWSDFVTTFTGRSLTRPALSKDRSVITFEVEPSQSDLDTALLTRTFTGEGGYVVSTSAITTSPGQAPGIVGGDWTVQFYGTVSSGGSTPPTSPSTLYAILDSGNNYLLHIYLESEFWTFRIGVRTVAGFQVYYVGSANPADILAPRVTTEGRRFYRVTMAWSQSTMRVNAWIDGVQTVSSPITSVMTGTEDRVRILGAAFDCVNYTSAVRVWNVAKEYSNTMEDPPEYPDEEIVNAYEFTRAEGPTVIDHGTARIDITQPSDLAWGLSYLQNTDGELSISGRPIPAAFGDCRNVQLGVFEGRRGREAAYCAAAVSEIYRVRVNGTPLSGPIKWVVTPFETSQSGGFVKIAPGATATAAYRLPLFGLEFVPGHPIDLYLGTGPDISITDTFIDWVEPSPYRVVPTGSTVGDIRVGIPELLTTPDTTDTGTLQNTVSDWDKSVQLNPYTSDREMIMIPFARDFPAGTTADIEGDPAIVAASPPTEDYVAAGDFANVITQILTRYGIDWSGSFVVPTYGDGDGRVGYFVNDAKVSVRQALTDLLKGHLAWLEEGPDGVSTLRFYSPVYVDGDIHATIDPLSVVDVEPVPRKSGKLSDVGIQGVRTMYHRNWTVQADTTPATDPQVRAFAQKEWSQVDIGDVSDDQESPTFQTFEVRKERSFQLGRRALQMSQADSVMITYREDPIVALSSALFLGAHVYADLPTFDLPEFHGIITGIQVVPATGIVKINLLGDVLP